VTGPEAVEALRRAVDRVGREDRGFIAVSVSLLSGVLVEIERLQQRRVGPPIVCLCGSTRFADLFNREAEELTLAGKIVVRPEVVAYNNSMVYRGKDPQLIAPEVKARLDELHLRKIDLADEVYVLNFGGYVGDSTSREIAYAKEHGKPLRFLEAK